MERIVNPINKYSNYLAGFFIFSLMVITFSDVIGRYFFRPITGTHELTGVFLALSVFLGLGYTEIQKGHISIDILVNKFSFRVQHIIELITNFMILIMLILMTQQTFVYALRSINNVTSELKL